VTSHSLVTLLKWTAHLLEAMRPVTEINPHRAAGGNWRSNDDN
jgi:hypothetical protein